MNFVGFLRTSRRKPGEHLEMGLKGIDFMKGPIK
jgi:hypothetical protein